MNILFLVLNKTEYLDEILDGFVDIGVKGATILDSQGMGSALSKSEKDTPFFGGLKALLDNARPYNKTVFTVIEDEETLNKAVKEVKRILGNINEPGVGLMFTLPVGEIFGMAEKR